MKMGKNKHIDDKKARFKPFSATFFIIVMIIMVSLVVAVSYDQFTNGLTEENMTFSGNRNITRTFSANKNITWTNARINLSGYRDDWETKENSSAVSCTGSCQTPQYIVDHDYTTLGFSATDGGNLEVNYAVPTTAGLNGTTKARIYLYYYCQTGEGHALSLYWRNMGYDSYNWQGLGNDVVCNTATATGLYGKSVNVDISGELEISVNFNWVSTYSRLGLRDVRVVFYNETNESWGDYLGVEYNTAPGGKTFNIILDGTEIYSRNGLFNDQNNQTDNFASVLNDAFNGGLCDCEGCSLSGDNCTLNITFDNYYSQDYGILEYSIQEFSNDGFLENSQTYNSSTYETSQENFILNLTYDSSEWTTISANLVYNGTSYSGTESGSGDDLIFSRTLQVPEVNEETNATFYWSVALTNSTSTYYHNSFVFNQTISNIFFGDCSANMTTLVMNFTAWDEETLERLDAFDFKATFYYWLGDGSVRKNVSFNDPNIPNKSICINISGDYFIDADIEYSYNESNQHVIRNYYFEDYTINNETEEVYLYLLNLSSSTSFILKVKNQNQQNVEGALVYTQRYYPGLGQYKTVQIARTDENGKSIGFFKTETVDYRFLIELDGVTELLTSKQKVIPEESPYTIIFTIGGSNPKPWEDFDIPDSLDFDLGFDNSTNITTFNYIDSSGNLTMGRLVVKNLRHNESDLVICNLTSTDSSASLECDVSGYSGSFVAEAYVTIGGEEYNVGVEDFQIYSAKTTFGNLGVLLGWFIILICAMAFLWHPIAGILGVDVAVIFVNLIGLVSFSGLFIWGLIAVSVILIFVLKD